MWARIGVQTAVEGLPWGSYSTRANHQEFSIGLIGWGSSGALSIDYPTAQSAGYFGTYVNDDWRVTQRLTINLGLLDHLEGDDGPLLDRAGRSRLDKGIARDLFNAE